MLGYEIHNAPKSTAIAAIPKIGAEREPGQFCYRCVSYL